MCMYVCVCMYVCGCLSVSQYEWVVVCFLSGGQLSLSPVGDKFFLDGGQLSLCFFSGGQLSGE